jgi:signal transduction histidine kinase
LSIAKSLVEAQGGTVDMQSEVEKGSTLMARLPGAGA